MPDLVLVFAKKWKFILGFTLLATLLALVIALLSPRKYLSVATALPANSAMADKARMFNTNIETLYSDFGSPDELDRLEGTGGLDTIFIAAARDLNLAAHYGIGASGESNFKAAVKLKKNSSISHSGYGELKIKVWDEDRNVAATMSNLLLQKIQELHQHLQNESNALALQKIREDYLNKQNEYRQLSDSLAKAKGVEAEIGQVKKSALLEQLQQYEKMTGQYQLALAANPPVLLTVEYARPSLWPDRPRILATVLLVFFAALLFSFLMSLFIESRKMPS
jgi:hypothetical protein